MKTKTLDERLRERARERLWKELQRAKRELEAAIGILGTTDKITIELLDKSSAEIYNRSALDQIVKQAFEKLAPRCEEKEISDFIKEVDTLQEQIDGVYQDLQP